MTKYLIAGSELYKNVRMAADFPSKPEFFGKIDGAKMGKIFSNPVTAIAYDSYTKYLSIENARKFDKKDIIKALDFWINDKVLENERLLKLHNKLEDFHETELKNLIEIRESVLKLDNDTKFCRFSDYEYRKYGMKSYSTDTVRFYQLIERDKSIGTTRGSLTITQGDPNPHNWRVSLMGHERTWGLFDQRDALIQVNNELMNRFPSRSAAEESLRQHRSVYDRMGWRNTDSNGAQINDSPWGGPGIFTVDDTPRNRELVRRLEYDLSSSTDETNQSIVEFRDMYITEMNVSVEGGRYEFEVDFLGLNGARMSCKFVDNNSIPFFDNNRRDGLDNNPHTLRILGRNRILLDGMEYTVLEPVRVTWDRISPLVTTTTGTPITREGNNEDFIDYQNMYCHTIESSLADERTNYLNCNLWYEGPQIDIHIRTYTTDNEFYMISRSLTTHIIRVFTHRKDIIQIDGQEIHIREMEIRHK